MSWLLGIGLTAGQDGGYRFLKSVLTGQCWGRGVHAWESLTPLPVCRTGKWRKTLV